MYPHFNVESVYYKVISDKCSWNCTEPCSCCCELLQEYLSCLPLQEGHFGQQAVAVTGLRLEIITHSSIQVDCFLQLLECLIQQTCRRDPDDKCCTWVLI